VPMPIKQTFKERCREESIWIALLIIFGITLIAAFLVLRNELYYYFNANKTVGTISDDGKLIVFYDKDNVEHNIKTGSVFVSENKKTVNVYYFDGDTGNAMVVSNISWYLMSLGIPLLIVVLSIYKLIVNLGPDKKKRKDKKIKRNLLDSLELGKILTENYTYHQRDIYEKHLDNLKFDTIIKNKKQKGDVELIDKIISIQDKIWRVSSVYLGIIKDYTKGESGIFDVYFTNDPKFLKDPKAMLEELDSVNVYKAKALIDARILPFGGQECEFYWVLSKPGLVEEAIMLPEWYYKFEEMQAM